MKLSRRVAWELAPNAISRAVAARRAAGKEILDLTETNPTRVGLGPPAEALRQALSAEGVERYEPEPFGRRTSREAVASWWRERGSMAEPEDIFLSASTSEAYSWLFKLLCDPGDKVLVPRPGYPLFDYLAGLESVEVVRYPLLREGRWRLDQAALEACIDERVRALVVVSPANPTGSAVEGAEISALDELCARRGIALIADEVFADYRFRPGPTFGAGGRGALTFVLSGLSKAHCLPQVKLAWTAILGPESARQAARERLEIIADTFLSVSTPAQLAAERLLPRTAEIQRPVMERLRANLDILRTRLPPEMSLLEPDGGWSAVFRVPRVRSDEEWVLSLLDKGVLLHPGHFFDLEEGFLVASLLPEPATFARAVDRIG